MEYFKNDVSAAQFEVLSDEKNKRKIIKWIKENNTNKYADCDIKKVYIRYVDGLMNGYKGVHIMLDMYSSKTDTKFPKLLLDLETIANDYEGEINNLIIPKQTFLAMLTSLNRKKHITEVLYGK
jgi:hypothetical protein